MQPSMPGLDGDRSFVLFGEVVAPFAVDSMAHSRMMECFGRLTEGWLVNVLESEGSIDSQKESGGRRKADWFTEGVKR